MLGILVELEIPSLDGMDEALGCLEGYFGLTL